MAFEDLPDFCKEHCPIKQLAELDPLIALEFDPHCEGFDVTANEVLVNKDGKYSKEHFTVITCGNLAVETILGFSD